MALNRSTLLAYALPAGAMAMPTLPLFVLLPAFYAEHTQLGLLAVGTALFVARLLDAGSDLVAGRVCDLRLGRLGRRRGWMLIGGLLLAPGLIGLFHPPAEAGVGWLLGFSLLLYLGWTLVQVPYLAWGADLSDEYAERTSLTSNRESMTLIGLLISAAWPALVLGLGFSQAVALSTLAWLTLLAGGASLVWLWRRLPEPPITDRPHGRWRELLRNRPWSRLMLAWLLNGSANGVAAVLFPFFVTEYLGLSEAWRGSLLLVYFGAAVLAMPVLVVLGQRIDKHRLLTASMLLACASFAFVPWLDHGDVVAFVVICAISGLALGADLALPPAMLADVVDWDRLRHRRERPALFFAGASFVTKLGLGLAVIVAPALLTAFGWQDEGPQSAAALSALALVYAAVPVALKLLAATLLWRFPLTAARHRRIRSHLQRRQIGATA